MAPWPPRPALVLVLLLALLCSHIALCSPAASGIPKRKASSGGRKALLAASDDDDGEDAPAVKPAAAKKEKAAAASGKIKKKVVDADAKNQTTKAAAKAKKPESAAAKAKKPESAAAAAKGSTTKKSTSKGSGDGALAKAKVPKADKAKGAADSAKPAPKVSKSGAGGKAVVKPGKPAKSEAAAAGAKAKAKKPSNSTADAGAKPAKSGGKKAPVVEGKASTSAKVNTTSASKYKELEVDEDVVFAEDEAGTDDLISEFRGLPARLQETLMPDLARLSHSSKAYLSAANAGIADGVRPILGGRWAAAAASAASVAALLLPLCMLTALVRRMGAVLPLLHRALLLAQAYLAIYFATLALAAAATGLEPLRFFHAASPAAYAWTQAAQSLGFVGYLVLQMVDLVAVFSGAASPPPEEGDMGGGDAGKALGLAQMVVGLAVGLHYYAAVFHRAAAGEAPRANWRVYAVYAACFVVICACARAERRKKAYLADGAAEEWKKS